MHVKYLDRPIVSYRIGRVSIAYDDTALTFIDTNELYTTGEYDEYDDSTVFIRMIQFHSFVNKITPRVCVLYNPQWRH